MKSGWKILIGALFVAASLLTACGKKGSNNNNAGTGACVIDQWGNCVGGTGGSGYVGNGSWYGNVQVTNSNLYREFLFRNRMCQGQQCAYVSNWFTLNVGLTQEWLPGPARFSLQTSQAGWPGATLTRNADAYRNVNGNGFQLVYSLNNAYGGIPYQYGYGQAPAVNQQNALQMVVTFVDQQRSIVNVQVLFRGQQIAVGTLRADRYGYPYAGAGAGAGGSYYGY